MLMLRIKRVVNVLCFAMLAVSGTSYAADGKTLQLYRSACMVCHASGVAGAPKLGDKVAWRALQEKGMDALMQVVLAGKGAMPPKGGASKASPEQLQAVVQYMLDQVQ